MLLARSLGGAVLGVGALLASHATLQDDEPLAVGDVAPAFTLNDQEGELVQVGGASDDWVVLAFYPKALTGG
ncbi:MAG: redoxin domain-containing protein [Planctomycetota bacterium]